MNTIRLIDPEWVAKLNADIDASVAKFRDEFIRFNLCLHWHPIIDQWRRDLDDELDWLGEWRGRRG
jgi:hypothetical protein